jgi:predicted alpha/beta hydrolase family esterase
MRNDINIILEKIRVTQKIRCGKQSIVMLSTNDVKMSSESFNKAIEHIWDHNLVKVLKVERRGVYIAKAYFDVTA